MPEPKPKKTITYDFVWFWGTAGSIATAVCVAFWLFHRAVVGDLREDFATRLQAEQRHIVEMQALKLQHMAAEHASALERIKVAAEAANRDAANQAKLDLLRTEREKDKFAQTLEVEREKFSVALDALRKDLAASRQSIQLKAGEGYLSPSDLIIDESTARTLSVGEAFINTGRLLLPNYSVRGWEYFPEASYAQFKAYVEKREILLGPPDDVDPKTDLNWAPMFNIYLRKDEESEAIVGVWSFTADNLDGVVKVMTGVNEKNILSGLPPGMIAHMFTTHTILADKVADADAAKGASKVVSVGPDPNAPPPPLGAEVTTSTIDAPKVNAKHLVVKDFSAKNDAFYMTATSVWEEKPFEHELLFTKVGNNFICAFSACYAKDALNPLRKEAQDWVKNIRMIKE
jgi:hypothetical protein